MNKFLIGSSTAAHQVEGNNCYSDYWAMEHMTYTEFSEKSLEAVDHYNHYREDIKMMHDSGLNAYRFSIEWARIEPKEGFFDEKEIKHYQDVIACCKEFGIEPIITLHHFTSPKWLIEKGGWENKHVVTYFSRYVAIIIRAIGNYVNYICTINEANMGIQVSAIAKRYKMQFLANMKKKKETNVEGHAQVGMNFNEIMKNLKNKSKENMALFGTKKPAVFVSPRSKKSDLYVMQAHMSARKIIKEFNPNIKVGITLSLHDIQVVGKGEKKAIKEWNEEFSHYIPYLKDDDFFGLQNYSRALFNEKGLMLNPVGIKTTQMGYEMYPEALEHVIRKVYKELSLPIMITENGIATTNDDDRIEFIKVALSGVQNARKDNIPVLGYLHWSFCDNFEWQKGFSMHFGLVSVDRSTMERRKKPSLDFLGTYTKQMQ